MRGVTVCKTHTLPEGVKGLALLAAEEGYRFLGRLVDEFFTQENCFEKQGEALFVVYKAKAVIGIGGVNIDPYAKEKGVGRVRRFYIHPENRRSGVGRQLLSAIEEHARHHFHQLRLYTDSEPAARFYEQMGYVRTKGISKVSHMKRLQVQ